jgi:galactokinase/mevalonate kinase-like predicted kinase
MTTHSSAPGRIGILGNPSDIYSGKVISMAIQYRAHIWLKQSRKFSVRTVSGEEEPELTRLIEKSLTRLRNEGFVSGDRALEVIVKTRIPRQSGMGGSTAIILAFLNACRKMFKLNISNYLLAEITQKIEHKELGITAGYNDRYCIAFGGLLFMDFSGKNIDRELWEGEPYAKIRPMKAKCIPLVCGYWGIRRRSGDVHALIRERYIQGDGEVIEAVRRLIRITDEGEKAITDSDWNVLAKLMNENYEIARNIGWAHPIDEKLRNIGLMNGAKAAKLGGAGNGGVMIFLIQEKTGRLVKALKDAGAKVFIPKVSEGVH